MYRRLVLVLVAAAAFASQPAYRGETGFPVAGPRAIANRVAAPGEVKAVVVTPQGVVETASVQVDGLIPVIIQLRDEPMLAQKRLMTAMSAQDRIRQLRQHQDRLVNAQAQLEAWVKTLEPGKRDDSFRHYRFAFNGIATKVSPETLKKLKQRPDVARVFRDGTAKANLADSVPLIGAPQIWSNYGADGQGIRVAVIDTGVDYNHPDLGGGFGPGFKVIGGYDFINGDGDPMDDFGHGTHVAGIIAANGVLKGVAPGAKLLAYKVLGADGSGPFSAIIAGIDRAVDPDQDPATNDGAQVLNLSLGGPGDPDDAISQAVDAVVNAGVVCVVAAGNSGSSYSTLGSPGCARKALTVGASDDQDGMATFSSRGPSRPDLAIKPDLTAPGVSIYSTVPGGGYQFMSGTSMATPHVAGAAALLLQLHPSWSPDIVKGVLAERAKDLGQDAFTQGGGRIQVVASHLAKGVALPNSLNFGVVDVAQGIWTKSLPMRLQNLDAASRTYGLDLQGTTVAGATWSVSPATVTLAAGQFQDVTITLTIDNSSLPFGPPPTMAYEAKLVATAPDDVLAVPIVFYKAAVLNLTFETEPFMVFINDQTTDPNDGFNPMVYGNPGKALSLMVPPRNYNVTCQFLAGPNNAIGYSYVFRNGIAVTGRTDVPINLDQEPIHKISLGYRDADQNEITMSTLQNQNHISVYQEPPGGFISITFGGMDTYYFSDFPADYRFEFIQSGWSNISGSSKYHEFKYGIKDGISQDGVIYNTPPKRVAMGFNLDPAIDQVAVGFGRVSYPWLIFRSFDYAGLLVTPPQVLNRPFGLDAEISSLPYPDFFFKFSQPEVRTYSTSQGAGELLLRGGYLGVPDPSTMTANLLSGNQGTVVYSTQAERLLIGESPHVWTGRLTVNPNDMTLFPGDFGIFSPLFQGQLGDGPVGGLTYEILQGATVVQSGVLPWSEDPQNSFTFSQPPSAGTLKIPYDGYFVNGQRGHAVVSMSFDGTKQDKEPPYLKRFRVLKDGEASSLTAAGSLNQLSLMVEDTFGLAQVQAFYQTTGDWQPLPLPLLSGVSAECLVDLPADLPQGPVNLKLVATDGSGNALTHEWAPAFYHFLQSAPSIAAQPRSTRVAMGQTATFSVTATGTGPLVFQWRKNAAAIDGATSSSYTTPPATAADDGSSYSVVVTNAQGSVTSSGAVLTVLIAPSIAAQPQNAQVATGQMATFSVTAAGTGPLAYQWRKNAAAISGATSSSYTTPPVTVADSGSSYSVVVTNAQGSVTSGDAILTVLTSLTPVVEVQPTVLGCFPGEAIAFTAKVTNATDTRVTWTASAGAIDASGRFTSPGMPGTVTITATSVEDPSKMGTATITVRGTDFDGNTALNPKLLGLANALGSSVPADLAKYDFNGDGRIDDADLAKLYQKMGW